MLAAEKFGKNPSAFSIKQLPGNTYTATALYRPTAPQLIPLVGDLPYRRITTTATNTIAEAIKEFYRQREWCKPDGKFVTEL